MGKDSRIEWTHHTFNPWWGCVKVFPACDHCYAESWAKRVGSDVWGPTSERRFFTDSHWKEPLKWNRDAAADGIRRRVFCASMADVFENRPDLIAPRQRLFTLPASAFQLLDRFHLSRSESWPSINLRSIFNRLVCCNMNPCLLGAVRSAEHSC